METQQWRPLAVTSTDGLEATAVLRFCAAGLGRCSAAGLDLCSTAGLDLCSTAPALDSDSMWKLQARPYPVYAVLWYLLAAGGDTKRAARAKLQLPSRLQHRR